MKSRRRLKAALGINRLLADFRGFGAPLDHSRTLDEELLVHGIIPRDAIRKKRHTTVAATRLMVEASAPAGLPSGEGWQERTRHSNAAPQCVPPRIRLRGLSRRAKCQPMRFGPAIAGDRLWKRSHRPPTIVAASEPPTPDDPGRCAATISHIVS